MNSLETIFQNLHSKNKGLNFRSEQTIMSKHVDDSLRASKNLVIEAGTGVGKSLAYLIPAIIYSLENQELIVISTETKSLQSQLLEKEIPIVEKILDVEVKVEIGLGSSNFVCKRKMENYLKDNSNSILTDQLKKVIDWVNATDTGNKMEFPFSIGEEISKNIFREVDNCLGKNCPNFSSSFYFKAKDKWRRATILIVNHHLLATHIANDFKILPNFSRLIIDEAHNFPEILRSSFKSYLEFNEIEKYLKLLIDRFNRNKFYSYLPKKNQFVELVESAISNCSVFFNEVLSYIPLNFQNYKRIQKKIHFQNIQIETDFNQILQNITHYLNMFNVDENQLEQKEAVLYLESVRTNLMKYLITLQSIIRFDDEHYVYWVENIHSEGKNSFIKINVEPIESSTIFNNLLLDKFESIVFTSATIFSGVKIDSYFIKQLGKLKTENVRLPSPYLYEEKCILFVPREISDPVNNKENYINDLIRMIPKILVITNGSSVVLFTSFEILKKVYEGIRKIPYPIFSQSELSSNLIKKEFMESENGVILGVSSFWQGIDFKGEKCKSIIITKIPFQIPDNPVLEKNIEKLGQKGLNSFVELQLPHACIGMKQGFGRLIRSENDYGIVSILDSRIYTKNYGKTILGSLPKTKFVQNLKELEDKFKHLPK